MEEQEVSFKKLRQYKDGTVLARINGILVKVCPYNNHPDVLSDPRIPGYQELPWPDCCFNCSFRHHNKIGRFSIGCGLTLNSRGYFSEASPLGKCEKHKKGESLFP